MSSPIFAMSFESRWPQPTKAISSERGRRRAATTFDPDMNPPIYIRGFPGFDASSPSSNVCTDAANDSSHTSNNRLDLHEYGGSDLENLVDRLQIREEHNDQFATRARNHAPFQRRATTGQLNSTFKPEALTELSTLFISMFHTGFCKIDKKRAATPYLDNVRRFFLAYMRNWDETECQRCERQFISEFKKQQHDKLSKDEWNYLCVSIKQMEFNTNHKAFQEFCSVLKENLSSLSTSPSSSSPMGSSPSTSDSMFPVSRSSSLTQSLSQMSAIGISEDHERTIHHSMDEIKRLYISIYYPNYKEFWNSDVFILSGSLMKAIDDFLKTYPALHSSVLKNLQEAMSE